ncbi:hypothetical protein ACIQ7D_01580 [Streptomyces sp. NPDC096310]|uniref:hypothetical protein n=1 Tax=Streptomyces sp. NPDC096310 TaxID=3366082 RepID=UPI00380C8E76
MPIDAFAALNALIRAEAARAETPKPRRRSPSPSTSDPAAPELVPAAERASADGEPGGSGTAAS